MDKYDEMEYITLSFDDDSEVECEIMGTFDAEDNEYIALCPMDGSDDVYLYKYINHGDEFELVDIEDEEEFEMALEKFNEIIME